MTRIPWEEASAGRPNFFSLSFYYTKTPSNEASIRGQVHQKIPYKIEDLTALSGRHIKEFLVTPPVWALLSAAEIILLLAINIAADSEDERRTDGFLLSRRILA